jgi:rod shape-determining protein MreB
VLSTKEVWTAIDEQVGAIRDAVTACIAAAPPDLVRDLIDQGIHLAGGGGMLRGLDRRLTEDIGVPVRLVDAPLECVVLGAGRCIESWDSLKVLFLGARD